MEQKGREEQDLPHGVTLEEGEEYIPFGPKPELSAEDIKKGYTLRGVNVDPMKPQTIGGWILSPPGTKSEKEKKEIENRAESWMGQVDHDDEKEYSESERKTREAAMKKLADEQNSTS